MLGSAQTHIVASAAESCAKALKQISSTTLKAQVKKVLSGRRSPEEVYGQLNEVALKASVKGGGSASTMAALRTLQSACQAVLDAWATTSSEKHRREIKALFHRGLPEVRKRRKKKAE